LSYEVLEFSRPDLVASLEVSLVEVAVVLAEAYLEDKLKEVHVALMHSIHENLYNDQRFSISKLTKKKSKLHTRPTKDPRQIQT